MASTMEAVTDQHAGDPTREQATGGHEADPLDPEAYRALGLTDDEATMIVDALGRTPNDLELAMYSIMWSEHCSYKSSRIHLGRLPSDGDHVLVGPGEGAGVVDVGDGIALALRIESHNHPSFHDPFEGASTGVGGILRDIFSMGARPIAVCDPLRLGPLDDERSRWITREAAAGAAAYARGVDVPIVGGETTFDATYVGNPLVNVVALGVLRAENLVLGRATGVGNLAVLLGDPTGRDGIGGVSSASEAMDDTDEPADGTDVPAIPAGNPVMGDRLIEACLEIYDRDLAVGVQDLGGAGITCATSETAAKGDSGMDVFVDRIPTREDRMTPIEVMTSETQERMLVIVEPGRLDAVLDVAARHDVPANVVGRVNDSGRLRVLTTDADDAAVLGDVPAKSLEAGAPKYDRPRTAPADLAARRGDDPAAHVAGHDDPASLAAALTAALCDTSPMWTDNTDAALRDVVVGPGADAAVLALCDPATGADTGRGIGLTADGNHRWSAVDPRVGTAAVVAESVLNLACVSARPVALVNNLNFGNPENPEIMWQLSEAVDGMAEACRAFGIPVVGGNVSLYNASGETDIDPTPIVGTLGIIDAPRPAVPGQTLVEGGHLLLVGSDHATDIGDGDRPSGLAGSRWAFDRGLRGGTLVPVDHAAHSALCDTVRTLVTGGSTVGVTDVSEGGIAGTLAEMAVRSGVGVQVRVPAGASVVPWLFGETPSRVLVCVSPDQLETVERACRDTGVACTGIGTVTGDRFVVTTDDGTAIDTTVAELDTAWRGALSDVFVE